MSIINNFRKKCCKYCEKIVIRTEDHEYFSEFQCCDDCFMDFIESRRHMDEIKIDNELVIAKLEERKQIKINILKILIDEMT